MTYLVEKPCARLMRRWFDWRDRRRRQDYEALAGKILREAPDGGTIRLTTRRVPEEMRMALEKALSDLPAQEGPEIPLLVTRGPCGGEYDRKAGFGWVWP